MQKRVVWRKLVEKGEQGGNNSYLRIEVIAKIYSIGYTFVKYMESLYGLTPLPSVDRFLLALAKRNSTIHGSSSNIAKHIEKAKMPMTI